MRRWGSTTRSVTRGLLLAGRCSGSSWLPRRKRHHYIQHCRLRSRPHPSASSSFPARSRSADAHAAKVSTQPQTPNTAKMHRSTLVINKFVGSTPLKPPSKQRQTRRPRRFAACRPPPPPRR
uniref:Uncharacterized protein n=1 Tax=Oryza barthii TaxID=65489 RepID=A0A0D3EMI8_9ORYZ